MVQKGVIIVSGGMDSATLLFDLASKGHDLHVLTFDYGQKHKREIQSAKKLVEAIRKKHPDREFKHTVASLGVLNELASSSLTRADQEVPEGHYADENMKKTVVPNRNMVMLSLAASLALSSKRDYLFYGAHSGDHAIYPDCRPPFVNMMKQALNLCDWNRVRLEVPYLRLSKADILRIGLPLGVPYGDTWSCYKGGEAPCGACGACTERAEAFKIIGVPDPAYNTKR